MTSINCPCCGTKLRELRCATYAQTWDYITYAQGHGTSNQRTCRKCKRQFRIVAKWNKDRKLTSLHWSCQEKL